MDKFDSPEKKVLDYIDAHGDEIADFVKNLVKYKTYNPEKPGDSIYQNNECQDYIEKKLQEIGMETELYEPDLNALEKKYKGTPNYVPDRLFALEGRPQLWSRLKGSGGGKSMLLVGHIDTVPAEPLDAWTHDPFGGEIVDGKLYGRGASDMKGGVGMMIKAVDFIKQAGVRLKGDVQIWCSNDEETGLMGSFSLSDRYMVEKKYPVEAAMDPECTSMEIVTVIRGVLFGEMLVKGVTGHAEGIKHPHWSEGGAVSAIHKAFKIFSGIEELNKEWFLHPKKQHPLYQCWRTVPPACCVTMIKGGSAPNCFAGDCTMTFDIQYHDNEKGEDVKKEFEQYITQVCKTDSWLKKTPPQIKWQIDVVPHETSQDHPLVGIVSNAVQSMNHKTSIIGAPYNCDLGSVIVRKSVPSIAFGPGRNKCAHQPDEHVYIKDLVKCCKIYALTLMRWCNGKG